MKIKVLLLFVLFSLSLGGQEHYRVYDKLKNSIYEMNLSDFQLMGNIEKMLNDNELVISNFGNENFYNKYGNPTNVEKLPEHWIKRIELAKTKCLKLKVKNKYQEDLKSLQEICLNCYITENNNQIERYKNCWLTKHKNDSIKHIKLDSIGLIELKEKQKQFNIELKKQTEYVEKQTEPYQIIKRHLDGISEVGYGTFTYFRGLDYNFASTRFQTYLQDNYMQLTPDPRFKAKEKPNQYCLRFVPRVSTEDEFLKVIFNFEKRKGYVSYYPIYKDGSSDIITSVEMIGTVDIMIKLFINYWPSRIKLGGYKIGEIAHYQIMGDYVSLVGVSTKICKIMITHGNIEADYYSTFKIKAPN